MHFSWHFCFTLLKRKYSEKTFQIPRNLYIFKHLILFVSNCFELWRLSILQTLLFNVFLPRYSILFSSHCLHEWESAINTDRLKTAGRKFCADVSQTFFLVSYLMVTNGTRCVTFKCILNELHLHILKTHYTFTLQLLVERPLVSSHG